VEKILVINCGSSSLKYEVYEMPSRTSIGKGLVERIGELAGRIGQTCKKGALSSELPISDHKAAMELVSGLLIDADKGIIDDIGEISGVGHRVVHGGEEYAESVEIDDKVISAIDKNIELAPLHNPANLTGIREAMTLFKNVPQVAVFDTAFHQTLPPSAYLYGLPRKLYDRYKIRRYGFHGTSHRYVSDRALELFRRVKENTNIISCHLGNGASITAIEHGRSVDTSMGFTPLEGLVMGTRSGDLDPAIVLFLLERGHSPEEINRMLNNEGGLVGLSGISNDLRDLEQAAEDGHTHARQALDVYAHRIRKYIGAYMANIVKTDIIVFTGGIGEHGTRMRERICHKLENIGIFMDYEKNKTNGSDTGIISAEYSPTGIAVIPTNEELQIAVDTYNLI
jgi:acetate kinase